MSEWISIKERLPDSYERVLVAISYVSIVKKEKKFSVHLTEMIPIGDDGKKFWNHNASEFIEFWQPLPAPPPK